MPGWLSLLPPLATLLAAVLTQEVVVSLLLGTWLGSLFVNGFNPLVAFLRTFDTYLVGALTQDGHGAVVLFWAPEFEGRNGFPPPEKNELVLSFETGCADTVNFQPEP